MNNGILEERLSWLCETAKESDVVLSCRGRLARNITSIPFPAQADETMLKKVLEKIKATLPDLCETMGQNFTWFDLADISEVDRLVLVERHVISPLQAAQPLYRAVIINNDNSISIMVNEEDHLRIQVMLPGLNLGKALEIADKIDDVFEKHVDYAFNETLGYLTACPTNIGTGLRVTAMLHMPGLVLNQQVENMARAAAQVGLIVRGMYGEGSEIVGDIFQVSNQLAMGYSEMELAESMTAMLRQIAEQERTTRQLLFEKKRISMEDMIWRAYGTLSFARVLDNVEAMGLYSKLLLGIDLNIISLDKDVLYSLMIETRPNHVIRILSEMDNKITKEELRALIVRNKFEEVTK